jgi:hypothetical protein
MQVTEISVQETIKIFLDGLNCLIPIFERAKLGWKDEEAYDPWDNIATTLYASIVKSAVDFGEYDPSIFPLIEYDVWVSSYVKHSYITEKGTQASAAFICFESSGDSFDTCRFALLNENGEVLKTYTKKIEDTVFSFVPRAQDGGLKSELGVFRFIN